MADEIRTAIREEQEQYRHRNVAKLLFMHMLGYPTHFGQLECMKLIASPHFPEKRIGYLGMMLLLSEQADVLMLATNSLKNDLNSDNRFVAGLALCAIGNLATSDMSRDLAPEVDKHLKSASPYLRKKACLAISRCLVKCPDMVEDFVDRVVTLLKDRSHGVLITVVQLMTQVLISDMQNREEDEDEYEEEESPARVAFLKLVPSLTKLLRNLLNVGYSPDHEIGGVSDPFLQVQILTLLRLLGTDNEKASEEMNDVLSQVATSTETSKNAGNAILYEAVQTIMAVESDDGLRVLAVNILGRFLLNRDNNIRYVALNTLSKCVVEGSAAEDDDESTSEGETDGPKSAASALQRHRGTVVDCLKDPDISIRQRALELIYHLVNAENVRTLTGELLNYLVLCPREHRRDICTRVLRVVERFSPDDRWRVDTLITMLTIAGRECSADVQSATIVYIGRSSEDLRAYATHKLLKAIRDDDGSQRGLLIVGVWCIGEYGDLLLQDYTYHPEPSIGPDGSPADDEPVSISFMAIEPSAVVSTVENVTKKHSCPAEVKERALTCFVKLSDRFVDIAEQETLDKLHELVKANRGSHSLEMQLRSCEYDALLNAAKGIKMSNGEKKDEDIFGVSEGGGEDMAAIQAAAKEALARMPVVDLKVIQKKKAAGLDSFGLDGLEDAESGNVISNAKPAGGGVGDSLIDLDTLFTDGGAPTQPAASKTQRAKQNGAGVAAAKGPEGAKSDMDLLSDIFSQPAAAETAPPAPAPAGGFDPFSSMSSPPIQQQAPAATPLDIFGGSNTPAPAPTPVANPLQADIFGATPAQPTPPTIAPAAPAPTAVVGGQDKGPVKVDAFSHQGLSVTFECTKPDNWNKQKSRLVAQIKNSTDAPIYGLSLQCAVPKYVVMEMSPPTSTTIPVTGGSNTKNVTQTIEVTNTMLGTKNLMLKLKVGFTSKGTKVEHMATCSGFPAGEY
uniref:AP-1 complex subunit gamma n=1 Tax=Helicotheca tamesis TaxID=374047 RepID=A0A7S2HDB5_9STRA